jgi:hypothetical protein
MTAVRCTRLVALVLLLLVCAVDLRGDEPEPNPDEVLLKKAGIAADGPALLAFFRARTLSDEEQARLVDKVQRLGDPSFPVRRKAAAELVAAGRAALPALRAALKDPDPERARRVAQSVQAIEAASDPGVTIAVARLLGVRNPEGAAETVLNYLPFAEDEVLEEDLLATLRVVGLRDGKPEAALLANLRDGKPVRRAAAAFVLGRLAAADRPAGVAALLADSDARVRFRAAQALLAGKEKAAVPVLVALLEEGPASLAYAAEGMLGRIAGEDAPRVWLGSGDDEERKRCRSAWAGWWKDHADDLPVTALDVEERQIGLTLICCCDGYNNGKGKVWEVDARGNTRWEINTANYPVDAVMVSDQIVLIAEQSGMCVTERDRKGAVLWEHKVRENLVNCQRLPNGNTFLATYSQMLEVTRDHKELYNFPTRHGTIYSAARLRNGHIAYLGSNGVLAEIDAKGQEIRALKVDASGAGLYKFEALAGGRFLLGQNGVRKVVELDGTGKVVWDCPLANANSVSRLPGGNVLACSWPDRRVVEVNRSGRILWELKLDGGPLRIQRR